MREEQIISLRPKISSALVTKDISEIEKFQNLTLRPILKFQNDLLIAYFKNFAQTMDKNWNTISKEKKAIFIETSLMKNQGVKNTIIGMTIGLFHQNEIHFYLSNKSEINRRIIQMCKERIGSNLPEL